MCEWCREAFEAYEPPSRSTPMRFCSDGHRLAWFSGEYRGERSPHWLGGKHPYGSYWKALANAISVRDGGLCRCCGKSENETGVRHPAAHLVPERAWPELEILRHHPANLVALCRKCHTQFDRNPATRYDYEVGARPSWPYWTAQPVWLLLDQAEWIRRAASTEDAPEVDEDAEFRRLIDRLNAEPGVCAVYGRADRAQRDLWAQESRPT